ncbi:lytic transglycosylase domain-containing protein [bacterium]|nr:lytic transglycosylase domain-containing protein [bacterium]
MRHLTGLLLFMSLSIYGQSDCFHIPEGLENRIFFWEKVFTHYSLDQVLIHDSEHPERIYQVLDFRELKARGLLYEKSKKESIQTARNEIRAILGKLAATTDTIHLSKEEKRIRRLFDPNARPSVFRHARICIHTQKGAMETFKAGLIRSGRYVPAMKVIFKEEGLPEDLVYLAHVESGFHPYAKSPAGALGVWQFIQSTGKQYLKIGSTIDERMDPILSTKGAAKLLKSNYQATESWPLAITAYNHGLNGIQQAVISVHSRDLVKMIQSYRSPLFGYASKNFYAEFLAARQIAKNPHKYFSNIELDPPIQYKLVRLPFAFTIREASQMFNVSQEILANMNPALKQAVTRRGKKIPRGYSLRVPVEVKAVGAMIIGPGIGAAIQGF